jgi:hypothetical protein
MEDSGGPFEPATEGHFLVFRPDGTVSRGCEAPGAPYSVQDGAVFVEMGASTLAWSIVRLDEETFVFAEGPDRFHYRRASSCP